MREVPTDSREEAAALLALSAIPGVGDHALDRLVRRFGSATEAMSAPRSSFSEAIGRKVNRGRADLGAAFATVDRAVAQGFGVHPRGCPDYPRDLLELADPPGVLFTRGDPSLLGRKRTVALVGARRATTYGRRMAHRLAAHWAAEGVSVVSGLALGIDAAAHEGALCSGGATVAVLGCGVDRPTPRSNLGLARRVAERGLLVSEFPPGTPARPHHFPRRNRIMAGLARAVVVVEGAAGSGALITVDHALDLGREIFALPGPVDRLQSQATNALIRDGAHAVLEPSDLGRAMGWAAAAAPKDGHGPQHTSESDPLLRALASGLKRADELADRLDRPLREVLVGLGRLELAGVIGRDDCGGYLLGGRR